MIRRLFLVSVALLATSSTFLALAWWSPAMSAPFDAVELVKLGLSAINCALTVALCVILGSIARDVSRGRASTRKGTTR